MPSFIPRAKVRAFAAAYGGGSEEIMSLISVYREAATRALTILSDRAASLASRRRALALLRQYQEILVGLNDESAAWLAIHIKEAYRAGEQFADAGVKGIRRAGINLGVPRSEVFALVHQEAVAAIVQEAQRVTEFALAQIGRRADDLFRREGMLAVARGIAEGQARREVSREIKERLIAQGKLQFVDKRGRAWALDRYTEMVARTTTREAMTQGTVNRLQEHGIRLGRIVPHPCSDFCIYYQGVVVSLTGEAYEGYPPISSLPNGGPPFHPCCKDVLAPFVLSLSTAKERKASETATTRAAPLLDRAPVDLQRQFRSDYPKLAQAEGKRLLAQAAERRRRAEKRAARAVRKAAA